MIPERITDEVYNNLKWTQKSPDSLDEEMTGYTVVGSEASVAWYSQSGKPATDGITLYLQKPDEERIKIINLDADYIYMPEEELDNSSPIEISVAYA